jgi:hypothetical protein
MNKSITSIFALLALCAAPAMAVPSGINYQGALTDDQGNPVTGTRAMSIKLYDAATGGTQLYTEDIGAVDVSDGVFSFEFGNGGNGGDGGTSYAEQSDTVALTDGTATTFQKVVSAAEVVAGSVSVTDGTYTWSQSGGSSNEDAFGVAYSTSLRRVSVTYFNGAPAAGRTITATYRSPTSGIAGALAGDNQPWAEITVNGVAQVPRQKVLTVPFAAVSARTLETEKADPIARQGLADLQQSVAQTAGESLTYSSSINSVNSRLGIINANPDNESWLRNQSLGTSNKLVNGVIVNVYQWAWLTSTAGAVTFNYSDTTTATVNFGPTNRALVSNPQPAKPVSSVSAAASSESIKLVVVGGELASVNFAGGSKYATRIYVAPSVNPVDGAQFYSDQKVSITLANGNIVHGNWNDWILLDGSQSITSISVVGRPTAVKDSSFAAKALFLYE